MLTTAIKSDITGLPELMRARSYVAREVVLAMALMQRPRLPERTVTPCP